MVLVSYILDNCFSLLQTKFDYREGDEARRVGLEAMPLDQHVKRRHGERQAGLEVRPDPVHNLFDMADERQHRGACSHFPVRLLAEPGGKWPYVSTGSTAPPCSTSARG